MNNKDTSTDVILIGAGVMSATLGTLLKEVSPDTDITVFEKLDQPAKESSNAWNNAGTGHSALCELNYTPENSDGSIDISKALNINEQFQLSKQFWSYLVNNNLIDHPEDFIRSVPHMSWVRGKDDVDFLKKRYEALVENPLFSDMEFTDEVEELREWLPLMMKDRIQTEPLAATKVATGTDVNFGALSEKLFKNLAEQNVDLNYNHTVLDLQRTREGAWEVKVQNNRDKAIEYHTAKHVFIGAGGGALPLLQKTGIPESKQLGGFPVSGVFLACDNPDIVKDHHAKVYGKAAVGAPPMSVPHLDTRVIDGKETLLFGPFAGFSPKFLKTGSNMDLINSVKPNNALTMVLSGAKNLSLTKYLVEQLAMSKEEQMEDLRAFVPNAQTEDWDRVTAGQRVQVIKDTETEKGKLQFGSEVVTAEDGSISALLGASPGASVAIDLMIDIVKDCFPEEFNEWESKITEMIPTYGKNLSDYPDLLKDVHQTTAEALQLTK
ncbi:MAG TPA: malate dehydrogenase (quinone) [Pseudogracilibacillus sp.]|nr:malate dehydrogenase (quinone) [Pseudogracilibacillus sp.]